MKRLALLLLLLAPIRARADAVAIALALAEAEHADATIDRLVEKVVSETRENLKLQKRLAELKAASPAPPATTRPAETKPTPSVAPARPQQQAAGERRIIVVPRYSNVPLNQPQTGRWVRVRVCHGDHCTYEWQWRPN